MSNTIKVKRGAAAPTTSNLEEYELGYSTNEKNLYIRDGNSIVPVNKNQLIFYYSPDEYYGTYQIVPSQFVLHSNNYYKNDYPYKAVLSWDEVRNTDVPIVIFDPITGFDISFKVESDNHCIYIYSTEVPTKNVHIHQIILMRG